MLTLSVALVAALLGPAQAQTTGTELAVPTSGKTRDYLMEVNFRGRYMTIPDSILDIWYFDEVDSLGNAHEPRPHIDAWAVGLEYVLRKDPANGIFYVEYAGNLTPAGYWDDVESPPDTTDGEYLVPDRLGLVTVGIDYAYALKASPWLYFMFGAGLGATVITGEFDHWTHGSNAVGDPDCTQSETPPTDPYNAPAYDRYDAGCGSDGPKQIPAVLPMLDINLGMKFNINDRANIRLEGGFHNMMYGGVATGIVF